MKLLYTVCTYTNLVYNDLSLSKSPEFLISKYERLRDIFGGFFEQTGALCTLKGFDLFLASDNELPLLKHQSTCFCCRSVNFDSFIRAAIKIILNLQSDIILNAR